MSNIAFLGTGLLGGAFAEAAAKRGDRVVAWNRSSDKARALAQFGVVAAMSPADAVRDAARIHVVLKDDATVEEVLAAARTGVAPDAVIIDHTTTLPALTAQRAHRPLYGEASPAGGGGVWPADTAGSVPPVLLGSVGGVRLVGEVGGVSLNSPRLLRLGLSDRRGIPGRSGMWSHFDTPPRRLPYGLFLN